MTKVRIVGDIHGGFNYYSEHILKGVPNSIQVGDFGIGFGGDYWHEKVNKFQLENPGHRFYRGNHDDPSRSKNMVGYIPDGTIEMYGDTKVMYIGGAWSIDWARRIEGVSWWRDEQLSYDEFNKLIDLYEKEKPDIMFTHDAPISVTNEMFIQTGLAIGGSNAKQIPNITNQALQTMFEIHQPKYWFFGHWHITMEQKIGNTRFHCIGENDYLDFDLKEMDYIYD